MTGKDYVDLKCYKNLHKLICRTLSGEMDEDEMDDSARADWTEDCKKYGLKLTATW
jgi:hypothetical protein